MCCSYNIPHTPDKGVYKSENFGQFLPKVYPLTPVIIFVKWVSKNGSINEYMNEFVVILKWINFKNGKLIKGNFEKFQNSMVIKIFSLSKQSLFSNTPMKNQKE